MGENAAKGAFTDAFRRAARLWGIGRYLLKLPKDARSKPTVVNESQLSQWLYTNFAKSSEKPKEKPTVEQEQQTRTPSTQERAALWNKIKADNLICQRYPVEKHLQNTVGLFSDENEGKTVYDVDYAYIQNWLLNRESTSKKGE